MVVADWPSRSAGLDWALAEVTVRENRNITTMLTVVYQRVRGLDMVIPPLILVQLNYKHIW